MAGNKRKALGKGLTALLSDSNTDITGKQTVPVNSISEIPLNHIEGNPFQPRESIDESQLDELADSIKVHGVIQPITVRKMGYDKFQIISGERRVRAAIQAGLKKVPAFVRVANDQNMLELALIENIHRENLNAVEIGLSYKRLVEECKLTQNELAERVGINRATVANYLRLLKLPEEIQIALCEYKLSMGHARALINIDDSELQLEIFHEILKRNLSVRKVEDLVKRKREKKKEKQEGTASGTKYNEEFTVWEQKLSKLYNTRVKIRSKKNGKSELVIPFSSVKDLQRISSMLENE